MIFSKSKNCEGIAPPVFELEIVTSREASPSLEVGRSILVIWASPRMTLKNPRKDAAVRVGHRPHLRCSPKTYLMAIGPSQYIVIGIQCNHLPDMCTTWKGGWSDTSEYQNSHINNNASVIYIATLNTHKIGIKPTYTIWFPYQFPYLNIPKLYILHQTIYVLITNNYQIIHMNKNASFINNLTLTIYNIGIKPIYFLYYLNQFHFFITPENYISPPTAYISLRKEGNIFHSQIVDTYPHYILTVLNTLSTYFIHYFNTCIKNPPQNRYPQIRFCIVNITNMDGWITIHHYYTDNKYYNYPNNHTLVCLIQLIMYMATYNELPFNLKYVYLKPCVINHIHLIILTRDVDTLSTLPGPTDQTTLSITIINHNPIIGGYILTLPNIYYTQKLRNLPMSLNTDRKKFDRGNMDKPGRGPAGKRKSTEENQTLTMTRPKNRKEIATKAWVDTMAVTSGTARDFHDQILLGSQCFLR